MWQHQLITQHSGEFSEGGASLDAGSWVETVMLALTGCAILPTNFREGATSISPFWARGSPVVAVASCHHNTVNYILTPVTYNLSLENYVCLSHGKGLWSTGGPSQASPKVDKGGLSVSSAYRRPSKLENFREILRAPTASFSHYCAN